MTRVVLIGLAAVCGVEVALIVAGADAAVLPAAGAAGALVLFALRVRMSTLHKRAVIEPAACPPAEMLARWLTRTAAFVAWADGTRGDWDRHVRPVLARSFATAVARRGAQSDSAALGRAMFGEDMWPWVDPAAASWERRDEPGPGRAVLAAVLDRMEAQ
jgi:hypothetical protein